MRPHLFFITLALAAVTTAPAVHAAAPGIGECLSATETSLKLRIGHKLRAARAQLLVCSAESCPLEMREECARRMEQVNASLPTVVFTVNAGAGQELSAVKVTMDGEVVADHLDGTALTLDPGSHEFTFETADQPPASKTIILHEGEKGRREAVVVGPLPTPSASLAARPEATPAGAAAEGDSGRSTQRTIGFVVGGAGVAGLVVGGIFGALSLSAHSSYEQECGAKIGAAPGYCNSQGVSGETDAATKGTLSTIFFIGGGVLAAAGVVLFVTAPRNESATRVGLGPGGVIVNGHF